MPVEIGIEVRGLDELIESLQDLRDNVPKAMEKGASDAGEALLRSALAHFKPGTKGVSDPTEISSRTGTMQRSLDRQPPEWRGKRMRVRVGYRASKVGKYVHIHEAEHPTVIRPDKAKVLAIPLPTVMKGSGESRFSSPLQLGEGGRWWKSDEGHLLFFHPKIPAGPAFIGLKKVRIKPRRPLGNAKTKTQKRRREIIEMEFERLVKKHLGGG
jgi:hypothetical protein